MQPGLMQALTRDQAVNWEDIQKLIAVTNIVIFILHTSFEKGKPFISTKALKKY